MSSGDFGGDHSVQWNILGDNVFEDGRETPAPGPGKPRPVRQWGYDESPAREVFTIAIKLPRVNPDAFINQLRTVNAVNGVISLALSIEDEKSGYNPPTSQQIVVSWPTDPSASRPGVRRSASVSRAKPAKSVKASRQGKRKRKAKAPRRR